MEKALLALARGGGKPSVPNSVKKVTAEGSGTGEQLDVEVIEPVVGVLNQGERELRRRREEGDGLDRRVIRRTGDGKSLMIRTRTPNPDFPPVIQPEVITPTVRIEITPKEKWTYGSEPPLQIFDGFRLRQDDVSYVGRSREEIAERCQARVGRLASDMSRIIEGYIEGGKDTSEGMMVLRRERTELEARLEESARREVDLTADRERLLREKEALKTKLVELNSELGVGKKTLSEANKAVGDLELSLRTLSLEKEQMSAQMSSQIETLKLEVEKAVQDVAKGIETGYRSCFDRAVGAGVDLTGHTFEDYCVGLAQRFNTMGEGNLGEKDPDAVNADGKDGGVSEPTGGV